MFTITAKQNTKLKKAEDSRSSGKILDEQGPDYLHEVCAGKKLQVVAIRHIDNDHAVVTFEDSYGKLDFNTWAIYTPHFEFPKKEKTSTLNTAKWFSQVNNSIAPLVTCNVSASASLASVYRDINTDEVLLNHVFNVMGYGASTDHNVVNKALWEVYQLDCVFDYNMTWDLLEEILDSGQPVVLGILHKGSRLSPYGGGHMICASEHVGTGKYKILDPFGSLYDGYQTAVNKGNGVIYTYEELRHRWTVDGDGSGWGRYLRNWRDYV